MTFRNTTITLFSLLAVAFTSSAVDAQSFGTSGSTYILRGDADADGVLTARDAEKIRAVLFQGDKARVSDVQMDFNRDGNVDIADSMTIEAYLAAGKPNRPRPEMVRYIKGDVNGDGSVDISDLVALGGWLFGSGRLPNVEAAADLDGHKGVTIGDFDNLRRQLMP